MQYAMTRDDSNLQIDDMLTSRMVFSLLVLNTLYNYEGESLLYTFILLVLSNINSIIWLRNDLANTALQIKQNNSQVSWISAFDMRLRLYTRKPLFIWNFMLFVKIS